MGHTLDLINRMNLDSGEMRRMGAQLLALTREYHIQSWPQDVNLLLGQFGLNWNMDWHNGLFIALTLATQMQRQLLELEKKYPGITKEPPTVRGYAPKSQSQPQPQPRPQPQPQPRPQPQPPKPSTKMEQRYEKMRTGQVKPRLRSDVPTELLVSLREQGYSYNKISTMTGLSKSTIIYRLR